MAEKITARLAGHEDVLALKSMVPAPLDILPDVAQAA